MVLPFALNSRLVADPGLDLHEEIFLNAASQ